MAALPIALSTAALVDQKHPDWTENAELWDELALLVKGGKALKKEAERFLARRPKELPEVFQARVNRFTDKGILGTCVGYYISTLFRTDPEIDLKKGETPVEDLAKEAPEYAQFLADCDRMGTTYTEFARKLFAKLATFGSAWVLLDLPPEVAEATSRAEQNLQPHVTLFDPRSAINWDEDQYGNPQWVVFAATSYERAFLKQPVKIRRWHYFDRTEYVTYEQRGEETDAREVDRGAHALADYANPDGSKGRVPVERICLPDHLWLASRAYLQTVTYLNQDNTLDWALFLANLAMPVIISNDEICMKLSEGGYLQLSEGSDFKWAEPAGTSFAHSAERLASLREEIYRAFYLQAQGRSSEATPAAQSGYSKEQDMAPAQDILNAFGDLLRAALQRILTLVAVIREESEITADVRGFEFADDDLSGDIADTQALELLAIPSDTFRREQFKRVVRKALKDANPTLLATCEAEIDAAPTREEQMAIEAAQADDALAGHADRTMARLRTPPA